MTVNIYLDDVLIYTASPASGSGANATVYFGYVSSFGDQTAGLGILQTTAPTSSLPLKYPINGSLRVSVDGFGASNSLNTAAVALNYEVYVN